MTAPTDTTRHITVRVGPEIRRALQARARAADTTVSAVVRGALTDTLTPATEIVDGRMGSGEARPFDGGR
jgi:2-keto-4-pentenoate hydratase